jgi:hypothetical protein
MGEIVICASCGHELLNHDGAGCNAQDTEGNMCTCEHYVDMPGDEPREMPNILNSRGPKW